MAAALPQNLDWRVNNRTPSTLRLLTEDEKTLLFNIIHKYPDVVIRFPTVGTFDDIYNNHLHETVQIFQKDRQILNEQLTVEKTLISQLLMYDNANENQESIQSIERKIAQLSIDIAANIQEQKHIVIIHTMLGVPLDLQRT